MEHGGKRAGAGRKSLAQKKIEALAVTEGKTLAQLRQEVESGQIHALRMIAEAMPEIVVQMVHDAVYGHQKIRTRAQEFLLNLAFKYGAQPEDNDSGPLLAMFAQMELSYQESVRRGDIRTPLADPGRPGVIDAAPLSDPVATGSDKAPGANKARRGR